MHLELSSGDLTLDLDGLLNGPAGTQLLEGLAGAGLPPVEVQWSEGAGHGAAYRGSRLLPRDFDLPLLLSAPTRAGLNAQLSTLARILDPMDGGTALLRATVPGVGTYQMAVVRVGGGNITHAAGSIGLRHGGAWLETVIQLRAGDPLWHSVEASSAVISSAGGTVSLNNTGDARAWPIWTLTGYSLGLSITGPAGQTLSFYGGYDNGETIIIDSVNSRITLARTGQSLYHALDPAPRFIPLEPGVQNFKFGFAGAAYETKLTCTWRPRRWALA